MSKKETYKKLSQVKLKFNEVTAVPIGENWYPLLKAGEERKPALFSKIPREKATQYFLVYHVSSFNDIQYRRYAAFRNPGHFFTFYKQNIDQEYHEVILGDRPQKPRFDIDLDMSKLPFGKKLLEYGDQLRNDLIESARKVLLDYNIELDIVKDLIICNSHSLDVRDKIQNEDSKYSCHIIFKRLAHANHLEAKEFFRLCVQQKIGIVQEAAQSKILDAGIYSSLCSLRILGCSKAGKRKKQAVSTIKLENQKYKFESHTTELQVLELFVNSAITNTDECEFIPIKVEIQEQFQPNIMLKEGAEEYIREYLDESFDFGKNEGSLICLIRKRPSKCKLCKTIHDKTHPFLLIYENRDVWFYCRRAQDANIISNQEYKYKLCTLSSKYVKKVKSKSKSKRRDGLIFASDSDSSSSDDTNNSDSSDSDSQGSDGSNGSNDTDSELDSEPDLSEEKIPTIKIKKSNLNVCNYDYLSSLKNVNFKKKSKSKMLKIK